MGGRLFNPMSLKRAESQVISHDARALDRYSASAVERATTDCFFIFHEMGDAPRRTQNPVVDHLDMGQVAQSLSQYALSSATEEENNKMPCPGFELIYRSSLTSASM